jgi:hypothetical protein
VAKCCYAGEFPVIHSLKPISYQKKVKYTSKEHYCSFIAFLLGYTFGNSHEFSLGYIWNVYLYQLGDKGEK